MKRTKSSTRRELEFDLHVNEKLPHEGVHCLFGISGGRGRIVHSPECPAVDMAFAKAQLESAWQGVEPLSVEEFLSVYTE